MASKKYTDSQLDLITDRILSELEEAYQPVRESLKDKALEIYHNTKGLHKAVNAFESLVAQKASIDREITLYENDIENYRKNLGLSSSWNFSTSKDGIIEDITDTLTVKLPRKDVIKTEILFSEMGDLSTLVETITNKFKSKI